MVLLMSSHVGGVRVSPVRFPSWSTLAVMRDDTPSGARNTARLDPVPLNPLAKPETAARISARAWE
jgi:hypothetical protein